MSKHSWRLSTPDKVSKIVEGFDGGQGIAYEDAEVLIGGIERLRAEVEALTKERDELLKKREADRFECCVMSAVTGREDGETLTAAVDRVTSELCHKNTALDAAEIESRQLQRSLATAESALAQAQKREVALREALKPFAILEVRPVGHTPENEQYIWKPTQTSRELPGISLAHINAAKQVLALTDAQLSGMALVEAKELAELQGLRVAVDAFLKWDSSPARRQSADDLDQVRTKAHASRDGKAAT